MFSSWKNVTSEKFHSIQSQVRARLTLSGVKQLDCTRTQPRQKNTNCLTTLCSVKKMALFTFFTSLSATYLAPPGFNFSRSLCPLALLKLTNNRTTHKELKTLIAALYWSFFFLTRALCQPLTFYATDSRNVKIAYLVLNLFKILVSIYSSS